MRQQLLQAATDRGARRDRGEPRVGVRVLFRGPRAHLIRVAILEPAIGIDDLDAVEDLDHRLAPSPQG